MSRPTRRASVPRRPPTSGGEPGRRRVRRPLGCGALLALALALAASAGPARAQLAVTGTTWADGQAAVALRDSVAFFFNQSLPFNSFYTRKFRFEPRTKAFRRYSFFDGGVMVRYTLDLQPNTDYAAYVYGVRASDGTPMARPFALNFTTAPAHGVRAVTGQVALSNGVPAKTAGAEAPLHARVGAAHEGVVRGAAPALAPAVLDLNRTVVLLLDGYTLDTAAWPVRAAAVLGAGNAFRFSRVRPGTYWPVALTYADADGELVGAYGFHDANGDLEPDPVTVGAVDVGGLRVAVLPDEPAPALTRLARARGRARAVAADARLVEVAAAGPNVAGAAAVWRFVHYSPAKDSAVVVDVGPINTQTYVAPADANLRDRAPLPDAFADSDAALAAAEAAGGAAFRAAHPSALVTARAGDLPVPGRPATPRLFWHVRYEPGPGGAGTPEAYFVALTDGTRLPVELVSFEAVAAGPAVRLAWTTASETSNAGFYVETRPAEGAAWHTAGFVAGRGTTAERQPYAFDVTGLAPGRHAFRLRQVDLDGAARYSAEVEAEVLADGPATLDVWPSPLRTGGTARFTVAARQHVTLALFDGLGRRVAVLFDGPAEADRTYRVPLAAPTAPGVYALRLTTARTTRTRPVVVAR